MVETSTPGSDVHAETDRPGRWLVAATVVVVVVGLGFRFTTRSPLWLDEALSVNIARLPIGEIPAALRQDGHPPLYYVLLHWWMEAFGGSDRAVRAMSGAWSVLLLPLSWWAARRVGGRRAALYTVILVASSPFAVRYATETRMYSMLAVLATAGYLVVGSAMARPTPLRLGAASVVTGLLLWTHYWALWLLAVAVGLLVTRVVRDIRGGRRDRARGPMLVLASMFAGGLTFVPWLGHLLYQSARTGTPWARPMRPAEMLAVMVVDFGGGTTGEAAVLGWALVVLAVVGVTAAGVGAYRLVVDLRRWTPAHVLGAITVGTMVVACAVGYATGATFASRYAASIHPFVMIMAGIGLAHPRPRWLSAVAVVSLLALSGVGLVRNITTDRSDAARSADAIHAVTAEGDLVVYCPDQLGPSTSRLLDPGLEQVTYPDLAPPDRVDWVDYQDRIDATSPEEFGAEVLARGEGRNIVLVYSTAYDTHRSTCPELFNVIGQIRTPEVLTEASEAYEPAGVAIFRPPTS